MTSCNLSKLAPSSPAASRIDKTVAELAIRSEEYDALFLLDDLETVNLAHPHAVTAAIRRAAERYLLDKPTMRADLRTKVSFHLAVPMGESWFFGDRDALVRAGVPETSSGTFARPVQLANGVDIEDFRAVDQAYLADDGSQCDALHAFNARKPYGQARKKVPWVTDDRARHPKHYIEWLCQDPTCRRGCSTYRETVHGLDALRNLAFGRLMTNHQAHFTFLRAFLNDLACLLGEPPWSGPEARETSITHLPNDPLLRNI